MNTADKILGMLRLRTSSAASKKDICQHLGDREWEDIKESIGLMRLRGWIRTQIQPNDEVRYLITIQGVQEHNKRLDVITGANPFWRAIMASRQ